MRCNNPKVCTWVDEVARNLQPEKIVWINGSDSEYRSICDQLIKEGAFVPLNEKEYPNSFWSISHPNDVARIEERTFICSRTKDDAGPTNNWADPKEMYQKFNTIMAACMRGRVMYVVPYLMGSDGSPYSKVGFELTDSLYVVANMRIMARVGEVALKNLSSDSNEFVRGIHSKGTLNPEDRYICHFPEDNTIISFNSDYGGNALQGKKCFALRIASALAKKQGWMAEHMLILGITTPLKKKYYITAAFPSACGKTNLAMLIPPESYRKAGWKVETVGDDIAWLNFGPDGRLYAINPEAGFFGVAPGTSMKTNPNAMLTLKKGNAIFTNTVLDMERKVPWWEGHDDAAPADAKDWLGNDWDPWSESKGAHPNSRFTVPAKQCPCIDPQWESPGGVPISAMIFGGRRGKVAPLLYETLSWQHGTFVAAMLASEKTAAAAGNVGELRRDPMAMMPFIGYHIGDYLQHWLDMGKKGGNKMPRIFRVNWFRTDENGKFLWPGFGDNMRVLEWMIGRIEDKVEASACALGLQPKLEDINLSGTKVTQEILRELLAVKPKEWGMDLQSQREFLKSIGPKLPQEMVTEQEQLETRLIEAGGNYSEKLQAGNGW